MRRSASEVIRSLEMRIARLEKRAMITRVVTSLYSLNPERLIKEYIDRPSGNPDFYQAASDFGLVVDEEIEMSRSHFGSSFKFKATNGRSYMIKVKYA
jgi:hypothetical protein